MGSYVCPITYKNIWNEMKLKWKVEHMFNGGITGLREPRSYQWRCTSWWWCTLTIDENIKAVEKIILDNCRITITEVADDDDKSFGSRKTICTHVLGIKLFEND